MQGWYDLSYFLRAVGVMLYNHIPFHSIILKYCRINMFSRRDKCAVFLVHDHTEVVTATSMLDQRLER